MSDILERIREVIKLQGILQNKFAEEIGITNQYFNSVLNGKAPVSTKILRAICQRYNIDMEWLKNGIGNMYKSDIHIDNGYIIELINELDGDLKKIALMIIEDLATNDPNNDNINNYSFNKKSKDTFKKN